MIARARSAASLCTIDASLRRRTDSRQKMLDAAQYFSVESLPNGQRVEIRALKPDDRSDFLAAVDRTSAGSLYRRFFGVKQNFTSEEVEFFLRIDFITHVALVAVAEEVGRPAIVGAGRYIIA